MTSNPFMIFPETADCGHVFLKIPGRSKIIIVLPGLFLIHVSCSGPQIFLRGPNTVRSSGCNLWEQCGGMIEELLHYLYSSPAHLLQGENSDYKQQEDKMFYVDFNTFYKVFHK